MRIPFLAALVLSLASCSTPAHDASEVAPTPTSTPRPSSTSTSPPDAPLTSAPTLAPVAATVVMRQRVGDKPCGIIGAEGRIWVTLFRTNQLISLDPANGTILSRTDVGAAPCGVAAGAGSIWVENWSGQSVTEVSATTGKEIATHRAGIAPFDVEFARDAAWVTNNASENVTRIDAGSSRRANVTVGGNPVGVVAAGGHIWVTLTEGGIVALDPTTGEVTMTISTPADAGWTAADDRQLWVGLADNSILQLDARTGEQLGKYPVSATVLDGTVLHGIAYIPTSDGLIHRLRRDGTALRPWKSTLSNPFVLNAYGGLIWVADYNGDEIVALKP